MPSPAEDAPEILGALADHYGRPSASTAEGVGTPEAVLAAALGRTLEPRKVALALSALREADLLRPEALAVADPADLAGALQAGGVNLTSRALAPLRRLARWFADHREGLGDASTSGLREGLVALNGIGPATADAVLLRGLGRASYPVDRASYRVAARHGWIDPSADEDEARAALERLAPDDPRGLLDLSGWSDRLGRDFCRAAAPRCERCPLKPFLPEGGPREPEA